MSTATPAAPTPALPAWLTWLAYALALAVPPLWAYSLTPSPTMINQLLSVALFGGCLVIAWAAPFEPRSLRDTSPLLGSLVLLCLAMAGSWAFGHLPLSLALPSLLTTLAALFVALHAAQVAATAPGATHALAGRAQPFEPFAVGLVIAGTLSGVVAVIQVFFPQLTEGDAASNLIARSGLVGRAVGNLRQPNHLASVLLWGLIALVPLSEWRPRLRPLLAACGLLMMLGVFLSASRTGWLLGLPLLVLWGVADGVAWLRADPDTRATSGRHLSGATRLALLLIPLFGVAMWWGLDAWAHSTNHVFGAHARLAERDVSSSRWGIWSNTLAMIRQQPWTGTGWGEFNFAWTLTPFPGRHPAFFDHTHDLPLQLLVELGLPLGGLVIVGLLSALALAGWRAWRVNGPAAVGARAAFMVTLMILVHSLLEYPLWYAYFLLPATWAWGYALGAGRGEAAAVPTAPPAGVDRWTAPVGALMVLVAIVAYVDYLRVSAIYAPGDDDRTLDARIVDGQRSWLYAHHADYADATSIEPPSNARGAFDRATHSLLDTRLMTAWSKELAAQGDLDRARYIAQRMLEFGKDQAEGFFDACGDASVQPPPYQCLPPSKSFTWRDFVRR